MVPSSEPVATNWTPRREAAQELTKEVWPLSFLTRWPTEQSHTAPVLSVDDVKIKLGREGRKGGREMRRGWVGGVMERGRKE